MSYFEKNWDAELQAEVLKSAESIVSLHVTGLLWCVLSFHAHTTKFREQYYELNGNESRARKQMSRVLVMMNSWQH